MEQALTNASLDGYVHFAKVIIVLLALVQHEESGLPKIESGQNGAKWRYRVLGVAPTLLVFNSAQRSFVLRLPRFDQRFGFRTRYVRNRIVLLLLLLFCYALKVA